MFVGCWCGSVDSAEAALDVVADECFAVGVRVCGVGVGGGVGVVVCVGVGAGGCVAGVGFFGDFDFNRPTRIRSTRRHEFKGGRAF